MAAVVVGGDVGRFLLDGHFPTFPLMLPCGCGGVLYLYLWVSATNILAKRSHGKDLRRLWIIRGIPHLSSYYR